jgi:hypothetical protein
MAEPMSSDPPGEESGRRHQIYTRSAEQLIPALARYERLLLTAGGAGALVSLLGLFSNRAQFFQSYLMAYMFVLGIALGCLAIGMVHQLSGGTWGIVIQQPLGAATRTLPLVTALFVPILFGMSQLYIWTHADVVASDDALLHKQGYLNVPFFIVRAAIYFVVWNALAYFLSRWSLERDRTGDPLMARRMQRLSGVGLVAYGLTITYASFDWMMSLEPHWYSTIYGLLTIGGQGLLAFAFLIVVLVWLSRRPPLDSVIVPSHFHDLANLTLTFVMLWAYFAFSQYLIIWAGNLPSEIAWYVHRLHTGWQLIGILLILFHFAVPFVLLLFRTIKRQAEALMRVCIGILVVRLIDLFWLIAPEFHEGGVVVSWLDLLLPLSLFSIWLGWFVHELRGRALLPLEDPQFEELIGPILKRAEGRPSAAR